MNILVIIICVVGLVGPYLISEYRNHRKATRNLTSDWASYYKKKLNLNKPEKKILNKISDDIDPNCFYKLDFCKDKVVVLFLNVYRSLSILPPENQLVTLFKYGIYELRRKYNLFVPFSINELGEIAQIESILTDYVKQELEKAFSSLPKLTVKEEKGLYRIDKGRWEFVIKNHQVNYSSNTFYEDIKYQELLTSSIVAKRNLYYDSYLNMADKDKVLALKFYMHYLHVGSESDTFKFRVISKANQKILFENEVQSKSFEEILKKYNKKKNIEQALTAIEDLFIKKRKRVVLDEKAIQSAKEDLVGVVDLLNEYLEDEEAMDKMDKKTLPFMENITSPTSNNIELNAGQLEFVEMFVSQSYTLSSVEVDTFANSKGIFKSQLIDGINDLCYDILDDMLIEEDEGGYTLNRIYYEKVIKG